MAETKPTASVKPATSVQVKKSSNAISLIAPVACLVLGYIIWRFGLGSASNFDKAGEGFFWPEREGPHTALSKMYLGGIIVPILIGTFLTMVTFVIERFLTIKKAVLGEKHLEVAYSYNSMGIIYNKQGEYTKALDYYEKSLAIRKVVLGEKHPEVAGSYNGIGST